MTEDLPLAATTSKGRTRAAMTAELLAAAEAGRVRIAIGRASDFFGAGVTESTLGARVFGNAVAGKRADFIGNPDLPHTYSYVPDIAAGLATLGTDERAVGQVWHLPGPETVTTRALLDLVAAEVGHPVEVRNVAQARLAGPGAGQPADERAGRDVLRVRGAFRPRHHQVPVHLRDHRHPAGHRHRRDRRLVPDPSEPNMTVSEAPAGAELARRRLVAARPPRRRFHPAGLRGLLAGPRRPQHRRRDRDRPDRSVAVVIVVAVLVYGIRVTAGTGRRPTGPEAKRIERSVTTATVIELVASFVLPVIVIAAGHRDWVLPSIAITIGPLLLWLDHLVHIPRYRPVGWALTIGPFILVATMSGTALVATTGLVAGVLLLGTAAAGFHDLADLRPGRSPKTVRLSDPNPVTTPEVDTQSGRFRPFFNPATGEHIQYTAVAEDNNGELVRFNWRSVPGGVITEHIHPHQEERFTITAGEARFTLNGQEHLARAGETVVVPAGVPHSEGNTGHRRHRRHRRTPPRAADQRVPRGGRRPGRRRQHHPQRRPQEPAPARRHLLALPPRKPGDLAAHLGPEPDAAPAVGAGEGLRRPLLLRPLGQPGTGPS